MTCSRACSARRSSCIAPVIATHRVEEGRYIAEHIPGARFVEFPGDDHVPWIDMDPLLDEVEEFLTGVRPAPGSDRVLATVLFTDLVGSTARAGELGDASWSDLLHKHDEAVRRELARFSGEEVDTAGDGFFACSTDRPVRSAAGSGSRRRSLRSGSRSGRASIRARSSAVSARSRVASPFMSARGSCRSRVRERSS